MNSPQTKCVLCGEPGGYFFKSALAALGVSGTHAHYRCVSKKKRTAWAAHPTTKAETLVLMLVTLTAKDIQEVAEVFGPCQGAIEIRTCLSALCQLVREGS